MQGQPHLDGMSAYQLDVLADGGTCNAMLLMHVAVLPFIRVLTLGTK